MAVRVEQHAEPLPGYRLIDRLGGGGFGEVWRAEAPGGMHKAIKFVFGDLSAAGEAGQRADQELKALKRVLTVRHPYILSLERYDIIDGQLLIVMELADRSLWDRFKECRAQGLPGIPRDELLRYMEESAEALDLMNQDYQLQHLDIKPQNIFLVHNHVKVADFGLVKDLEGSSASITGGLTPVYAAPETFDGRVSRFSDQYSFAILYQELLTGQRPFNGTNVRQLIMQHISAVPDVSPLPASERGPVSRALAKTPDDRFPSCREFVAALRGAGSAPAPVPLAAPSSLLPDEPETVRPAVPTPGPIVAPVPIPPTWQNVTPPPSSGPPTANIRLPIQAPPSLQAPRPARAPEPARPAPPEATGPGCLFPAVLLGLGQTGLSLLQRTRDLLEAHAAPLHQLSCVRSLLLDADPEIARAASRERSPAALAPSDILIAPLNRPSHYQKGREGRPALDRWLNMRLVYRIPRSMVTTGIRALGRLAFVDNHRPIARRLQAELEAATDPAALQASARASRLGMRTNRPRVYVLAGLAGGTGGGMFLDAAYTARALLRRLGYENPDVVGVLLVPPLEKGRGRAASTGNAYAALAELEHFGTPGNAFRAHYDDREAAVCDDGPPFSRTVLLPMAEEGDEVAAREAIDLAGQFLLRDLATPLGKAADLARAGLPSPAWESRGRSFSTFGMFQLSWPRRALLSAAGRRLCSRTVQRWLSKDSKPVR
ncbi:MAG: protein kinase, partial [Gemmataceae bacterium]|nr:protein kinase [Gemmataceae bacterium]